MLANHFINSFMINHVQLDMTFDKVKEYNYAGLLEPCTIRYDVCRIE